MVRTMKTSSEKASLLNMLLDRLNKRRNEETEDEEDEEEMTCETLKEQMRRIRNRFIRGVNDFEADKAALRHPFFPILITDEHGDAVSAPPLTTLAVSGVGECIPIPIPLTSISLLKEKAAPLSPLKARETQWQIEGYNVWSTSEPSFFQNTVQKQVSSYLCTHLQLDGEMLDIEAKLHKLYLIGPKGNYKQLSKEEEKQMDEMQEGFGTYLLQIPVEGGHQGGELIVKQSTDKVTIETQAVEDKMLHESLLLSRTHFEIKTVESGYVCYLVFKLDYRQPRHKMSPLGQLCMMVRSSQIQPLMQLVEELREAINTWQTSISMEDQPMLALSLTGKYDNKFSLSLSSLNRDDSILVHALLSMRDILNVYFIRHELNIECNYRKTARRTKSYRPNVDGEESCKKRSREEFDNEDCDENDNENDGEDEVRYARKSLPMSGPAWKRARTMVTERSDDEEDDDSDSSISSSSSSSSSSDDSDDSKKMKLFGEESRQSNRRWIEIQDRVVRGLTFKLKRDFVTDCSYEEINNEDDIFGDLDSPRCVRIRGSKTYFTYYHTGVVIIPKAFSQKADVAHNTDQSVEKVLSKVKFDGRSVGDMMVKLTDADDIARDMAALYPHVANISKGYYLPLISVAVKLQDHTLAEMLLECWLKKKGTRLEKSDHVQWLYLTRHWGWSVVAERCFELVWTQTAEKTEFLEYFEYVHRFKKDSQWAKEMLEWILQRTFAPKEAKEGRENRKKVIAIDHEENSKDENQSDEEDDDENRSIFNKYSYAFCRKLMTICLTHLVHLNELRVEMFKAAEDFSVSFFGGSYSTEILHVWFKETAIKLFHASRSEEARHLIREIVHHREEKLRLYFAERYGDWERNSSSFAIRVSEEKAKAMSGELLEFLRSRERREFAVKDLGSIDKARKFAEAHLASFARQNKLMYSIKPNGAQTMIQVMKIEQGSGVAGIGMDEDDDEDDENNFFSPGNLRMLIEEMETVRKQLEEPPAIDLTKELPAPMAVKEKKTAGRKKKVIDAVIDGTGI